MGRAGRSSHTISDRPTDGRSSLAPSQRATRARPPCFIVGIVDPDSGTLVSRESREGERGRVSERVWSESPSLNQRVCELGDCG